MDDKQITDAAIDFYPKQFTQGREGNNFSLLNHIPELIFEEDNIAIETIFAEEEVR